MARTADIGEGRIGYLPIGGGLTEADYPTLLTPGQFVVEIRLPSGELVAMLENTIKPGYEEIIDAVGRGWASLDIADSKWANIAMGRQIVFRERGQRPKVFIIKGIRQDRQ